MGKLDGKVALISGGAKGQGAAEARTFAREGAKVVFGDILDAEGKKVEEAIRAEGGEAAYVHLDVTSEADWQNAVKLATGRYGRLDILVNNAAIVIPRVSIEERTAAEWDQVMAVNAKGVFLGTKYVIPAMRRAGGGSIINISSQLGLVGSDHTSPHYSASKGAVRLLTKTTALQYAREGIRVNSVHPGPIETPMTAARRSDPAVRAMMVSRIPLGRYGQANEVAYGVVFLASDEASFVTGSELVIDGGWTAQ
jgi:cyclopentanol dehydrogenase